MATWHPEPPEGAWPLNTAYVVRGKTGWEVWTANGLMGSYPTRGAALTAVRRERRRRRIEAMVERERAKLAALDPGRYPSDRSYRRAVVHFEARIRQLEALLRELAEGWHEWHI